MHAYDFVYKIGADDEYCITKDHQDADYDLILHLKVTRPFLHFSK